MAKRKPTAADRDIADYIRGLPLGRHIILTETDGMQAPLKCEGGLILFEVNGKRITIMPQRGGEKS